MALGARSVEAGRVCARSAARAYMRTRGEEGGALP